MEEGKDLVISIDRWKPLQTHEHVGVGVEDSVVGGKTCEEIPWAT